MPTLANIQWTTAVILALACLLTFVFDSEAAAAACFIGGMLMMGNLFALGWLARLASSLAAGGRGIKLGVVALPLKLVLLGTLVYVLLTRTQIDQVGFAIGLITQMFAILFQSTRASLRARVTAG